MKLISPHRLDLFQIQMMDRSTLRIDDCKNFLYIEYNVDANVSDSESCINLIVEGCTNDII